METTPETLRAEAAACDKEAQDSFDRCDTDGFLSQYASGITADLKRRQAEVLENGGIWDFPALFDLNGARVRAKLIDTRVPYRQWQTRKTWAFCDTNGKFTGQFISAFLLPKNMEKKGYREGTETAKAKAVLNGRGYGLSGTCWVEVARLDKGYPENAI